MVDVTIPKDWHRRERSRFVEGKYKLLPWHNETFFHEDWEQRRYSHISVDNPSMVAFTETDAKGEADIQTRMKPGKYLRRFYGEELGDAGVQYWAQRWNALHDTGELEIATSPDDIVYVYTNGPSSCMAYRAGDYATGDIHPTYVYGAGDIGVAYMRNGDGDISARTVVNLKDKYYIRIYGDCARFEPALAAAGYTPSSTGLNGCRMLKVETDCDGYICPWLDGSHSVDDDGEYLVVRQYSDGEYSAASTNGLLAEAYGHCENCDSQIMYEEDAYYVEPTNWSGMTVCESCYEEYGRCNHCEYHSRCDELEHVAGYGIICEGCIGDDVFVRTGHGDVMHSDDVGLHEDGEYYAISELENDGCEYDECSGEWRVPQNDEEQEAA